ncbi:regulatory protein RecX [Tsukamurella soli]|uniref:regulatory protein RecX n=1 Tax=Tsukamurella soli TaxID=644556 RepID=UPI00361BE4D2
MHIVAAGGRFEPVGEAAPDLSVAAPDRSVADLDSEVVPDSEPLDPGETVRREGQARDLIYRALAARDHSTAELRTKLAKRGFDEDLAERVLAKFVHAGLVDDAAFAQRWVESRHRYAGRGRRALAMELQRRGSAARPPRRRSIR